MSLCSKRMWGSPRAMQDRTIRLRFLGPHIHLPASSGQQTPPNPRCTKLCQNPLRSGCSELALPARRLTGAHPLVSEHTSFR